MSLRLFFILFLIVVRPVTAQEPPERWYKGNTHAHTLWDNGDSLPECVTDWYRSRGYAFVGLSDHNGRNALSGAERWVDALPSEKLDELSCRFGADWAVMRKKDGRRQMRLKTSDELERQFNEAGRFLLLRAEEVGDSFEGRLVHHTVLNLERIIAPPGGRTLRQVMSRAIDAANAESKRLDRPVIAHLNHPNLGWAVAPEDLGAVGGERFFEIYNGHPAARNAGDAGHPGSEEMWDRALTARLRSGGGPLLYGVASDDAHDFTGKGDGARPGRGWIMVRTRELTGDAIARAMLAGDFYSSTGVTLQDVKAGECGLSVKVAAEPGTNYTIRFIGDNGTVLEESKGIQATYCYTGDELYVRAVVVSDRPHPNPTTRGELQAAWIQPVLVDWNRQK